MPSSAIPKHWTDGTITVKDGTAVTPLSVTERYGNGDFNIANLSAQMVEPSVYYARGRRMEPRKGQDVEPSGSWSGILTEGTSAGTDSILDIVRKTGGFAAAVSTLGTQTGRLYTLDLIFKIEGTDLGDSTDHTFTFEDCHCVIGQASEGQPNAYTINWTCYGVYTIA